MATSTPCIWSHSSPYADRGYGHGGSSKADHLETAPPLMEDYPGQQDGDGRVKGCHYGDDCKLPGASGSEIEQVGDA